MDKWIRVWRRPQNTWALLDNWFQVMEAQECLVPMGQLGLGGGRRRMPWRLRLQNDWAPLDNLARAGRGARMHEPYWTIRPGQRRLQNAWVPLDKKQKNQGGGSPKNTWPRWIKGYGKQRPQNS